MTPPLVSVITPAYNAARYLEEAVKSALEQTHANIEVIIVNDGSTDETAAIAESLAAKDDRVKVIHQENRGVSAARNTGLCTAIGQYISFLDADDAYLPNKIGDQLVFLQNHPEYDLVFSDWYNSDGHLNPIRLDRKGLPPIPFEELYVYRNWFVPIASLMRASLTKRAGEFDTVLRGGEDWDYWTRCAQVAKFGYLPITVAKYRTHPKQAHNDHTRMYEGMLTVIHKHYGKDRRRYRLGMGAHYWQQALMYKYEGKILPMVGALVRFLSRLRNYREMRHIMQIVGL